jgi:small conductance mechanosensitive channel
VRLLLANLLLLGLLAATPVKAADLASYMKPHAAPAATQPAQASTASSGSEGLVRRFDDLTIGKLFKGERKLSPEELGHIEFWVALVKEPLIAGIGFIPRVFVAFVFLAFFYLIYRAVRRLIVGSLGKANVDPSIRDMLGHLVKWTIMGFGLVIAFNQIGIQITALLTGVSIIGLAMGLAAQETLANFIAGIVIFWDKPFRIGDSIEIEGASGTVQRVTFRSTRMLDADGQIIVLPNTYVLAHRLSNASAHTLRRVNVTVGIAYKESIDDARETMLELVEEDARVCADPAPSVVVTECGDSSVNLILRFWVRERGLAGSMKYEYLERVKKAFDARGIEIPFPHVQLLMNPPAGAERTELRAAG